MAKDTILLSRMSYPWEFSNPKAGASFTVLLRELAGDLLHSAHLIDESRISQNLEMLGVIFQELTDALFSKNYEFRERTDSWLNSIDMFAEIEAAYTAAGVKTEYVTPTWFEGAANSFFLADKAFGLKGKILLLDAMPDIMKSIVGPSAKAFETEVRKRFPNHKIENLAHLVGNDLGLDGIEGGNFVYDPFNDRILLGINNNSERRMNYKLLQKIISEFFDTETYLVFFDAKSELADPEAVRQMLIGLKVDGIPQDIWDSMIDPYLEGLQPDGRTDQPHAPAHLDQCLLVSSSNSVHITEFVSDRSISELSKLGYKLHPISNCKSENHLNVVHITPYISLTLNPHPQLQQHYAKEGRILHTIPYNIDGFQGGAHCLVNRISFNSFDGGPDFMSAAAFRGAVQRKKPEFLLARQKEAIQSFIATIYGHPATPEFRI